MNTKRILAVIFSALMLFALCSCKFQEDRIDSFPENETKQEDKKEEQKNETVSDEDERKTLSRKEVKALADAALEKMSEIPEYPEVYPTLDAVASQYRRANEAIGWVVGTELVATDGNYTITKDGMQYSRVLPDCYLGALKAGKDENADMLIYNMETLEAYFATLIRADEAHEYIVDIKESFEIPKFVEASNGELYALPYAFAPSGYGEDDTYELRPNGDGSYTLSVHYTTLDEEDKPDGEYVYDVKYVNENGRWVFEDFRVVKQH